VNDDLKDTLARAERAAEAAARHAEAVDAGAAFPEDALAALRQEGLLGLVSSKEVGGLGRGLRDAAHVVERLGRACGSTAMVTAMHYSGAGVVEAHGPEAARRAIARGEHLSTLAFSEVGSRSHFWAPMSTARASGDEVVLDAKKGWITSARRATSSPLARARCGSCPRRRRGSRRARGSRGSGCAATTRRRWPPRGRGSPARPGSARTAAASTS
jgi:alkylation response protein AidB-like acyl-CoA dehydrogenase